MNNKVYQMVTDRIIEQLNQGIIPWHKPTTKTPAARSTSKTARRATGDMYILNLNPLQNENVQRI